MYYVHDFISKLLSNFTPTSAELETIILHIKCTFGKNSN